MTGGLPYRSGGPSVFIFGDKNMFEENPCADVKQQIILKALIVIGIFAEYYFGKKGTSGLDILLTTVATMATLIVFGIIIVVVSIIERMKKWTIKN